MAPPKINIPPEILERARPLYESGTSLQELGRLMGVSDITVRNRAIELGWSRARPARPVADIWPDAPPPLREPSAEDTTPKALRARLSRMVAREMLRAETYNHAPAEAARTLAMLSKIVVTLNVMDAASPATQPEEEVDLDQWRLETAAKLEALMDQYAEEAAREEKQR